jgi:hypothetical protein
LIADIRFNNIKFIDNEQHDFGAGLYISHATDIYLSSVEFINNKTLAGCGALYISRAFNIKINNSAFINNRSDGYGGAMCFDAAFSSDSRLIISGAEFRDNNSKLDNGGAAIAAFFNGNYLNILASGSQLVFFDTPTNINNTTKNGNATLLRATFSGDGISNQDAKKFIDLIQSAWNQQQWVYVINEG